MLFKIDLYKYGKNETKYVDAQDVESAKCFADEQAESYGCEHASTKEAYANEIPKDAEITYLTPPIW